MKAQANTTREQSNKKSKQVGDPRTVEMEEQEKKKFSTVIDSSNKNRLDPKLCFTFCWKI